MTACATANSKSDTLLTVPAQRHGRATHVVTWILQGLLGLQFVFAGAMKFVTPIEEMTKQMPLPAAFLYFIGCAELLGGLGLILPGALKMLRGLTPLAAMGLSVIMAGAVVLCARLDVALASVPLIVGGLCAFVAWRRWSWFAELKRAS
jgi:uncharacterized membrane protein